MAIDQAKLDEFLGRFVADLGAVFAAPPSWSATSSASTRGWPPPARPPRPSWPPTPASASAM
jgi:hypothetical protein